jgi:CheY-like chemotaxis protein
MPSPTILIVEDNDDNLNIYSTILKHGGYEVIEAVDGEAALEAARGGAPALILMDVSIPKIDGFEVTRILKADPATARIPIVALTAHALPGDRDTAMAAGCDAYIAKPAEPRVVLREVERLVGAASAP